MDYNKFKLEIIFYFIKMQNSYPERRRDRPYDAQQPSIHDTVLIPADILSER